MKNYSRWLVTLLLMIPVCGFSSDRAFERYALVYHEKLMNGEFEQLEKDAESARKEKTTISDGQPLLSAIYGGISGCEFLSCSFPKTLVEWRKKGEILSEWIKKYPESKTAKIGYAVYYVELGWFYRGGGYSNTVSSESFVLFRENLKIAEEMLNKLPSDIKADPGWSYGMLVVGLSQGWVEEEFDRIYGAAVKRNPEYIPFYFLKAAYMEPKWYGSLVQFNKFVDGVVENTAPVLGDQMYARLHWSGSGTNLFRSGRTDWSRMKKGFDEILANYPDGWNVNNYAKFACLAGDKEQLAKLLLQIEVPLRAAWFNDLDFYKRCSEFAKN
jgi:hypothetical protein